MMKTHLVMLSDQNIHSSACTFHARAGEEEEEGRRRRNKKREREKRKKRERKRDVMREEKEIGEEEKNEEIPCKRKNKHTPLSHERRLRERERRTGGKERTNLPLL